MVVSRFALSAILVLSALNAAPSEQPTVTPNLIAPPVARPAARFDDLFRPPGTDRAALSPDGRYLAYTVREEHELSVIILEVDKPAKPTAIVKVVSDEQASAMMDVMARARTSASIRWMRWVTATRLVMETNRTFATQPDGSDTWLNTSGEIIGVDADGKNIKPLANPNDVTEWSAAAVGNFGLPRSPRIVDLCDDDPDSIWLQTESLQRTGLLRDVERYKLNVFTGKTKSVFRDTINVSRTYLFDRAGRPRIAVPISTLDPLPHSFLYDTGKKLRPWQSLDSLVTGKVEQSFTISPENYFSQRSVPLGFGLSPEVLYYASNIGRETYGIYSLNLKTGEKGAFVAESPTYDLYAPIAGVFPDTGGGSFVTGDTSINSSADSDVSDEEASDTTNTNGTDPAAGTTNSYDSRKRASGTSRSSTLLGNLDASPLVIDRFTHEAVGFRFEAKSKTAIWFNPQLAAAQTSLEAKFPGRSVEILEWDSIYKRLLVRVSGNVDSGAFYIYDIPQKKLMDFIQCHPWLSRDKLHRTAPFIFRDALGQIVSGTFTFPMTARSSQVPVVVLCNAQPWDRVHATFEPELQAYAEMGFAVVQVNPRRAWGYGWKQCAASSENHDAEEIAVILEAVDQLARQFAINPRRIAIAGTSHGGYLALRALQLQPERFRCAIATEPVLDIKKWISELRWTSADTSTRLISAFFGNPSSLPVSPVMDRPEQISKPVLIMSYRGDPDVDEPNSFMRAKRLQRALSSRSVPCELIELDLDYMRHDPVARAESFRKIEGFLNATLFDFDVKAGELKTIQLRP